MRALLYSALPALFLLLINSACEENTSAAELAYSDYLDQQAQIVQPEQNSPVLTDLIPAVELQNAIFFFTGERHGVAANLTIERYFLRQLVTQHGYRRYFVELPMSHAERINAYLQRGNLQDLRNYMELLEGTNYYQQEIFEHWQAVRAFYAELPKEQRFRVIGCDIEFQFSSAISWAIDRYQLQDAPPDLQTALQPFVALQSGISNRKRALQICDDLRQDIQVRRAEYESFLDPDRIRFRVIVENIRNALYYNLELNGPEQRSAFNAFRDSAMYANFNWLYEPGEQYYGQWGNLHAFQRQTLEIDWLATLLQNDPRFSDRIATCHLVYEDCQRRQKVGPDLDLDSRMHPGLYPVGEADFLFFHLNRTDSPFRERGLHPTIELDGEQGPTTDYFQYLFLLRHQAASSSYQ